MVSNGKLHMKAIHLGYKRNRRNQHPNQSRIQIEGVKDRKATQFYLGKRIAYVYKAQNTTRSMNGIPSKYRVMWGRITAPHGDNGIVKAKFRKNLPPASIGKSLRVMLYPSTI